MTQAQARKFLERLEHVTRTEGEGYTCIHGHLGCSDHYNGYCVDEVLGTYPELEDFYLNG